MLSIVQTALRPAWRITLSGIVIGGLAGFFALLTADGTEPVAQSIATVFLLVAVLPPLVIMLYINQVVPLLQNVQVLLPNALLLTLTATWVGLIGATFLFWVVSSFGAGLLGGEDTDALRSVLLELLVPTRFLIVFAVDTGFAFALAYWFVQTNGRSRI